MDENERLLTTNEVIEMLRLSRSTFENLRQRGQGPKHVKVGRQYRYRKTDIEEWIETN